MKKYKANIENIINNLIPELTKVYEELQDKGYEKGFKEYIYEIINYYKKTMYIMEHVIYYYEQIKNKYKDIQIDIIKDKTNLWIYIQVKIKNKWYDDKKWVSIMKDIDPKVIDILELLIIDIIDKIMS